MEPTQSDSKAPSLVSIVTIVAATLSCIASSVGIYAYLKKNDPPIVAKTAVVSESSSGVNRLPSVPPTLPAPVVTQTPVAVTTPTPVVTQAPVPVAAPTPVVKYAPVIAHSQAARSDVDSEATSYPAAKPGRETFRNLMDSLTPEQRAHFKSLPPAQKKLYVMRMHKEHRQ